MWPWNNIERRFFEIPDDKIAKYTILPGDRLGIVCTGVGLNPKGTEASPQSKKVVCKAIDFYKLYYPDSDPIVILTAGYQVRGGLYTEARAMERYITGIFFGAKTFKVEDVDNTHLEVRRVIDILKEQRCNRAIVIGQQLHLTRIRALFQKIGANSGIQFFFVKARSRYGGNSQWRLWCFPFFLFWEKAICFPYLKLKKIL